ncbi:MAG: DUF1738 domain-containing protein [Coriobacteriaceae bacterium]|nr:DUF1738 domain-containing protein [Coriobacteriaceae bacterium]
MEKSPALEKIKRAQSEITKQIIEDMRRGGASWIKNWVTHPPFNPVSATCYSGRNFLILQAACLARGYDDPRWVTFNQARAQGWRIRAGARSVPIEKWREVWERRGPDGAWARIAAPKSPDERRRLDADPGIRCTLQLCGHHNLFNAADVDGMEPLGEVARGWRGLDHLIGLSPVEIEERYQDRAFYSPAFDSILIPHRSQFRSEAAVVSVLAHELTHATVTPGRLARPINLDRRSREYAREELVAELGSVFILSEMGYRGSEIDFSDDVLKERMMDSAAYLASWSRALENPEREVLLAATAASRASEYICHPERRDLLHERAVRQKKAPLDLDTLKRGLAERRSQEQARSRGIGR